jgi:hypothetical protein
MIHDLSLLKAKPAERTSSSGLSRRQLLGSTAGVALAAGVMTTAFGRRALAAGGLSDDQKLTLLRVARDIYPHETLLDNAPYQAVLDGIYGEAAKDSKVGDLLASGLDDLEKRAQAVYKTNYAAVKDPLQREGLLRQIELSDFFQKIRGGLLFGLYNNKGLYPKFGYDGSSWEHGGWIKDASFGKVDWLGL